jgi:integrative and conjugative element protein (TIGR02256 family)
MPTSPVMIFRTGLRLVTVADEVVETISAFSRRPENGREAGGILVGSYRGPHIQVTTCSGPMARDRRTATLFDRCDPGHQEFALKNWRDSAQTKTFVGEWHTHPEHRPSPSRLDLRTWRHVAGNNIAGNTVFLIKGYEGWWAGLTVGKILTPMTMVPQIDE